MRPLTVGELLDAAVVLLRSRAALLVSLGVTVAVLEQAVLFPLRRLANVDLYYRTVGAPVVEQWPAWSLLVSGGFATEALAIGLLAGVAAAVSPRALLGDAAPAPERAGRPAAAAAIVAVVAAAVCGLAVATVLGWLVTYFLLVPVTLVLWIVGYGLLGPAAPATVIERVSPTRALGRGVGLAVRGGLRALRVRVLAYLGWFLVRLAWGMGMLWLIRQGWDPPTTVLDNVLMAVVFGAVNAVMYPAMACLDAVLYLEARMRTEGLDIALRDAVRRRTDPTPLLVGA